MGKKLTICLSAAGAAAAAAGAYAFLIAPARRDREKTAPFYGRNFAHRGLHKLDKSVPENSIPAFDAAARIGYGIELDVRLSADGRVVVFHDDDLKRICGVDARVDELSWDELSTLKLCGTPNHIPLFSEVLAVIDGRCPIIVELKRGRRHAELCRKTYELLRSYKGRYCVESFDPRIVFWFPPPRAGGAARPALHPPCRNCAAPAAASRPSASAACSPISSPARTSWPIRWGASPSPSGSANSWAP